MTNKDLHKIAIEVTKKRRIVSIRKKKTLLFSYKLLTLLILSVLCCDIFYDYNGYAEITPNIDILIACILFTMGCLVVYILQLLKWDLVKNTVDETAKICRRLTIMEWIDFTIGLLLVPFVCFENDTDFSVYLTNIFMILISIARTIILVRILKKFSIDKEKIKNN